MGNIQKKRCAQNVLGRWERWRQTSDRFCGAEPREGRQDQAGEQNNAEPPQHRACPQRRLKSQPRDWFWELPQVTRKQPTNPPTPNPKPCRQQCWQRPPTGAAEPGALRLLRETEQSVPAAVNTCSWKATWTKDIVIFSSFFLSSVIPFHFSKFKTGQKLCTVAIGSVKCTMGNPSFGLLSYYNTKLEYLIK